MENKVTTKEDLIKRILEQRERLSFFGVTSIGLFGSFVRGEHTDSSDVDILVEFTPEKHTFDNFMDVSFLLEDGRAWRFVPGALTSPSGGAQTTAPAAEEERWRTRLRCAPADRKARRSTQCHYLFKI
jgi:predicted nucleotidyltransferase